MEIARRPVPWRLATGASWRSAGGSLARGARWADAAIAAGLVFAICEPGFDPYHHSSGTLWATIGVAGTAALAWRRASPWGVWLIATVASGYLLLTRQGPEWGGLSPLILMPGSLVALCTVAGQLPRAAGRLTAAVSLISLEGGLLSHQTRPEAVVTTAALVGCAWAVGDSARTRREGIAALRDHAVAQERGRIARELHDIVAHHVSVISLQAGTARLLAESGTSPDAALLEGIETASRQAMTSLRHALGLIRHTPGGAEPLPGLARLPELTASLGAQSAAGSGLAVTVTVDGAAGPLPTALDLTAYRIIQESLTNVLRHSAARAARVTLRQCGGALHITVADDGPARAGQVNRGGQVKGGHGLSGLRERVAAHGGTFRAGSRAGAGFEVSATLPVPTP